MSKLFEDSEGQYRPEFVRRIKKASARKPDREFTFSEEFLESLDRAEKDVKAGRIRPIKSFKNL